MWRASKIGLITKFMTKFGVTVADLKSASPEKSCALKRFIHRRTVVNVCYPLISLIYTRTYRDNPRN